jgi:hypothetical protein
MIEPDDWHLKQELQSQDLARCTEHQATNSYHATLRLVVGDSCAWISNDLQ